MRSENVYLKWGKWDRFQVKHDIQQSFNGAIKSGLAYHWNERLILSAGYRYQFKSFIRDNVEIDKNEVKTITERYGVSHQISLSVDYIVSFRKSKYPVFIAYQADYLPSTPTGLPQNLGDYYMSKTDDFLYGYQFLTIEKNSNISKNIAFGIQFPFYFVNLHLVGQYLQNSIHIFNNISNHQVSNRWWPSESFQVKKSTFLFNLGVSFVFNRK